jgi:ubiquinol oxidase
MEELGGADRWFDRFIAQHISVAYYWIVFFIYLLNPTVAYNLNQVVEEHAYATYDEFIKENGEELRKLPAPQIAKEYYRDGDLYMFDDFQTGTCEVRRPEIRNLYDVFVAIRDDEAEHVKTMTFLQTEQELTNVHDETCLVPNDESMPFLKPT